MDEASAYGDSDGVVGVAGTEVSIEFGESPADGEMVDGENVCYFFDGVSEGFEFEAFDGVNYVLSGAH